ncbi:MAG: dTDP-4-dehydrorhamnose reductase [Methanosaeta sp. SDB]|nr:MAG: dTDP-4-dehydrorhamnose reductase [Methanosaeta sp. SDB]
MRIFITGGSGLLGSRLAEIAADRGHEVVSGYCHHLPEVDEWAKFDLENRDEIKYKLREVEPDVVFHTAALTDVDRCETDRELAWRTNVLGTELVAKSAAEVGAFVVYASTDYVFDGRRGMYREDDRTDPVNHYGLTKLLGESFCDCVARTCVIYGARPASGKVNFALWLIDKLRNQEPVKIVTDQYITPTLNTNLAKMLLEAGEKRLEGTYHMAGSTRISRYGFAVEIARKFGLDSKLLVPSKMSDMIWKAKRPADSSLDTSKAQESLEEGPRDLKASLRDLREEMSMAV